jgi:hypothetical protein
MNAALVVLKRFGVFLAVGGVLGDVVTILLAPNFITWFHTPGTGAALCNCADVAKETAGTLVRAQLIGTLVGAVVFVIIGELAYRLLRAKRRQAEVSAAGPGAPIAP